MLSPTSVHLTWVAPCHTQQYHIYYRGTCGAYVDESRLDTDHQECTVDGLQEDINYSFTVTQTGPVYARTFTAGEEHRDKCIFSEQLYCNFNRVAGGLLVKALDYELKDPGFQSH